MATSKFEPFSLVRTPYKSVNGQDIPAFLFVPKTIINTPGKYPVLVKIHGGALMTGSSLFEPWFAQWVLDYMVTTPTITIAFDYRLMPESSGTDIFEDVCDFWSWLKKDFPSFLEKTHPGLEADLEKVAIHGESSGAHLAIVSAFTQPAGSIKAVLAAYPVTDLADPYYSAPREAPPPSEWMPFPISSKTVQDYLATTPPGSICTAANPPARMELAMAALMTGDYTRLLGDDERMYPFKMLGKLDSMPYMFVYHGEDDELVPVVGSKRFAEKVREAFGEGKLSLLVQKGGHGFDAEWTLETPELKKELEAVERVWLKASVI